MGRTKNSETMLIAADDFKLIHGIGPGLEARLHTLGIRSYAQLAGMSPDEVVRTLGNVIGLTVKRVEDQDWIGQARKLVPSLPNTKSSRQHYATFTIELLLDSGNNVRRTRAVSIQKETEDTWAGWDENRLLNFVAQQAGLQSAPLQAGPLPAPQVAAEPPIPPAPPAEISGQAQLKELHFTSLGAQRRGRLLAGYQPFEIQIGVDLDGLVIPGGGAVNYTANVTGKVLGKGPEELVGEAQGLFKPGLNNEVFIKNPGLNAGMYRLNVHLWLNLGDSKSSSQVPYATTLDGGLLKIY